MYSPKQRDFKVKEIDRCRSGCWLLSLGEDAGDIIHNLIAILNS